MRWAVLLVVGVARVAYAQRPEIAPLVAHARELAREGRCIAFSRAAREIEKLDPDYYAQLVHEPDVAPCFDDERAGQGTAIFVSLGATLAGGGMLAGAAALDSTSTGRTPLALAGGIVFAVGPTAGHLYAGELWSTGLGVRAAGLALGGVGLAMVARCEDTCHGSNSYEVGQMLVWGGVLAYAGGAVYEIIDAGRAAHEHNASLMVAPTRGGVALSLSARF